jgi:hypothetical protein
MSRQNLAHGLATPAQPSGERLAGQPMPAAPLWRGGGVDCLGETRDRGGLGARAGLG